MSDRTVRLHRVLQCPPEKVYRAFLEPAALAKWLPPGGFTCQVHALDARVGGGFKMSFQNFGNGQSHSFGGTYLELQPHRLLRYNDRFDDPGLPGEMLVTVQLALCWPAVAVACSCCVCCCRVCILPVVSTLAGVPYW